MLVIVAQSLYRVQPVPIHIGVIYGGLFRMIMSIVVYVLASN